MRLVLIEASKKKYSVFEGSKCLAEFVLEEDTFLDKDQIEELRLTKLDEKA
jgi:hypothetical protein